MAQVSTVSVEVTPSSQSAYAGDPILFTLELAQDGLLPPMRELDLVATSLEAWNVTFTPAHLTLQANGKANATASLQSPANLTGTFLFTFDVRENGATVASGSANVTLRARPAPETNPGPQPPALALTVTPSSGAPGEMVRGTLTLQTAEPQLEVNLRALAPAAWNARFHEQDATRILYANEPVKVAVLADVPAGAPEGEQTLTVRATANGFTFDTPWTITVTPGPTSTDANGTGNQTGSGTGGAPGSGSTGGASPAPRASISARLDHTTLDVGVGETQTTTLRLRNDGDLPLHLAIAGNAGDGNFQLRADPATLALEPGSAGDVTLTLTAPSGVPAGGSTSGAVMISAEEGLVQNVSFSVRIVEPTQLPDETPPALDEPTPPGGEPARSVLDGTTLAIAAGLGAVGAGAVALANRPLREKLIWAAVGLYTRLARPDVLGHEERERLYKLVETQPGIHFHALQRDLGWNTGTLTYHLRVLEKHGFLVSRRDGLYRRFYLQGAAPRKEVFENAGPQGLRADVLEAVRNRHGMSQSDLALLLGQNKQTVNYHVKALERQGLIRVEKKGRETILYPAGVSGAEGQGELAA